MFSTSSFNKHLEKATSQLLLEPDWDTILQIVDCIRQGDVQSKTAVQSIKKKISHENPHVSLFALLVTEACVKNCGSSFHNEVATKEFCEFLKDQAKARGDPVKEKILELIQTWSHAFRNEPKYKAVEDTFHLLKMEGHKFPVFKEADAMFDAGQAPQWKEGETCNRCRVKFSVMLRQHHCRNCGEVFCNKCSSKVSAIPKLGFEREVRVCDSCYDKINKTGTSATKKDDSLPPEYLASPLSKQSQAPPSKTDQEQQEEDELQLALALSKSEHETKEKERSRSNRNYVALGRSNEKVIHTPAPAAPITDIDTSDMDPELARYLNRNFWQQKSKGQAPVTTVPSAPSSEPRTNTSQASASQVADAPQVVSSHMYQNGDSNNEQNQFLKALQGSLDIFVNRMRSNSTRGRPIANDTSVQSLFKVISEMHPQLMAHIQEKEESRGYYEDLQDKLTQLRDAREALDSLREEHKEKKRLEAEELERQRHIQMMQKLEVMRQKKSEYMAMQQQLHLQRLKEQEMVMNARAEQQRYRTPEIFGYAQNYQPIGQPGGPPPQQYGPGIGNSDGSPQHMIHPVNPEYQSMQSGVMSMGPQSGIYSGGQPLVSQFQSAPGGYQQDGQAIVPTHLSQDQAPMSLPPHSIPGQLTTVPTGSYGGTPNQVTTAGLSNVPAQIGGMDSAIGYSSMLPQNSMVPQNSMAPPNSMAPTNSMAPQNSMPPQVSMPPQTSLPPQSTGEFQPFNMQGLSTALPPQNNAIYGGQQQQGAPQQFPSAGPPQQANYPPASHQFQDGHYQQTALGPPPQQPEEPQLISFD